MDKGWVHLDRRSPEYYAGLKKFLDDSPKSVPGNEIVCPCIKCKNRDKFDRRTVEQHLVVKGMWPFYMNTLWKEHGESHAEYSDHMELENDGEVEMTGMQEFLNETFVQPSIGETVGSSNQPHIFEGPTPEAEMFYKLLEEANKEVYPGCKKFKKLEAIVRLYQLKCLGGMSDNIFSKLLEFIKELLPEGECLPESFYQTKKLINELGLTYEKIDACPNDCMLFWKDDKELEFCRHCQTSRYIEKEPGSSGKRVSAKVLRYFPIKPRLQRLYMSKHTASHMRWHATECPKDGFMRHPSDSPAWKHLDLLYPDFGSESRNVRLGLASDGFNPFGNMSTAHSTWPVVLSVYNLPPWMCMKQSYLFLSLLIPGPRGPGYNIDVYLEPLIDDLKDLWENGITTYDVSRNERFTMRAALLWTINDFPAYGNLSGWSTKGFKACPHCMNETVSERLKMSRKICYLGHRRFLPIEHRFRRLKAAFNNHVEDRVAPRQLTGMQCLVELSNLSFSFGQPAVKRAVGSRSKEASTTGTSRPTRGSTSRANRETIPWKKKSNFYKLPYWGYLLLRNNIDVMHTEKNISDSILGTLLDINKKTKDGINARADLELMKIRKKQHPRREGSKTFLPPGPFTTSKDEKTLMCEVLSYIRATDGYAANLSRCINVKERRIYGLKSHDHHVIMQQFLAIAIRHILPKATKLVLLEVSAIFRHLCFKKLSPVSLEKLKERAALVLCQMEKMFPPTFFDIMVHLLIHLPEEAAIAGPVQFRWMYPIERYLCTLKKYVRNKSHPEGSIAEGYIVEETLSFCSMYLDNVETRRNRVGRNADSNGRGIDGGLSIFAALGHSTGRKKKIKLDQKIWEQCHKTVLFNCNECQPYIQQCLDEVKQKNRRTPIRQLQNMSNKIFPTWFKQRVNDLYEAHDPSVSEDLLWLANGPRKTVTRYNNHIVNGFRFRIKSIDDRKKNQNCGVFYTAATPCYSSASDRNPRVGEVDYYGVIKNIYELHYRGPTDSTDMGRNVVLFDCEWVDSTCERGKKIDQYGFTLVNFKEVLHTEDTFVLASSAIQTFYVNDPVDPNWNVAVVTQPRDFYDVVAEDDASVTLENPLNAADHYAIPELDDHFMDSEEHDTRLDVEGIHVDQVLPDLNDMMELDSDDDLSTEDEDEDDLYDDMEY